MLKYDFLNTLQTKQLRIFFTLCYLFNLNIFALAQTIENNSTNPQDPSSNLNQIEFKTINQNNGFTNNNNQLNKSSEATLLVSPENSQNTVKPTVNPTDANSAKSKPTEPDSSFKQDNNNPNFDPKNKDMNSFKKAVIQELPSFPTVQKTTETIEKVKQLLKSGENYFEKNDLDKALEKWQNAYGMSIEMKYPEGEGATLTNMCLVFIQRHQYVKARYLGENAIEVLATTNDVNALARARVALAQAYFGLDNSLWAVQQLDAALKILTKEGTNNLDTAKLMNLAGSLLLKYGKYKEALQFFKQGVTCFEQAGNRIAAVNNEISVINLMQEIGLYTAASEEASRAIESAKITNNPSLIIATKSAYANCEYNLGEYSQALKTYADVVNIFNQNSDSLKANTDLSKANINVGLACTLIALGRNKQALSHLQEAVPKLREAGAKINEAQAMNALGIVNDRLGNYAEANRWFSESLELLTLVSPTPAKLTVTYLLNQAVTEYHQGINRTAKIHIENALNFLKKYPNVFLEGRCQLCLAEILLKLADSVNAQTALDKTLKISTKINDDQTSWRAYLLLAKIQLTQNLKDQAIDSLKSSISFFRSPLSNIHPSPESLFYVDNRNDLGFDLISLLSENDLKVESLLALEQIKDEKFLNVFLSSIPNVKPEDREVFEDLKGLRSHLYAAENVSKPSELINDWKNWIIRFNNLKTQNPNLASMMAPIPLSYSQIIQTAKEKNLFIVDYLTGPKSTIVFTLSGSQAQLSSQVLNIGEKQLNSMVKQVLYTIGQGASLEQQKQSLHLAYQKLFGDILNNIKTNESLIILPDSVLFNLPFPALVDNNNKFLIETKLMAESSTLRALINENKNTSGTGAIFIDSDPNQNDVNSLSKLFAPGLAEIINQTSINIASLSEKVKDKGILQIFAKINFNHESPLNSDFDITNENNSQEKINLQDFVTMDLPSDAFILSKSSLGNDIEDGLALNVINRSLSYAGARNQLFTLWFLPNSTKNLLLLEFFKEKLSGQSTCKAYQTSLNTAIKANPRPSHWAAFKFFGQIF